MMAGSGGLAGETRAGACVETADLWKGEVECRAFLFFGFNPDAATVAEEDALNVGEADARAFEFLFEVQALKDAEEFANVLHIKAYTIIAHKYNVLVGRSLGTYFDFSGFSRPSVFDGIGNEVGEDDAKHGAVANDFGQGTDLPFDGSAAKIVLQTIEDFGHKVREVNASDAHFNAGHAGELQEIIDQLAHLAGGGADAIQLMEGFGVQG